MNKELIKKLEQELKEVDEKLAKLNRFISICDANKVGRNHLQLLHIQYTAMQTYYNVLSARIELIESED